MTSEPIDPADVAAEFAQLARAYLVAYPNVAAQTDLGNRMAMLSPRIDRLAEALAEVNERHAEALARWVTAQRALAERDRRIAELEADDGPSPIYGYCNCAHCKGYRAALNQDQNGQG